MRRILLTIISTSLAIQLAGCAGRAPNPVSIVQPQDSSMNCAAIYAEAKSNGDRITSLGKEQGGKVAQNVAAGVAGLFIWPLWFAMDFQGAAGTEAKALQDRQSYLATLASERGCTEPVNTQPAPAASEGSPKKSASSK